MANSKTKKETKNPRTLMKCGDVLEVEQSRKPIAEPCSQVGVFFPSLGDDRAHRGVEQPTLPISVVADDVEDPDVADRIGDRAELPAKPPTWAIDLMRSAAGVGSRVIQIGTLFWAEPIGVGLDPAMRVLLSHIQSSGQLIPVASLEAVDDSGGDVDGTQEKRKCAGEVFAVTLLAIDQEVFDRIEAGIDLTSSAACS